MCQITEVVGVPSDRSTVEYGDCATKCGQITENVGPMRCQITKVPLTYINGISCYIPATSTYAHVQVCVCGGEGGGVRGCTHVLSKTHSNSTGT